MVPASEAPRRRRGRMARHLYHALGGIVLPILGLVLPHDSLLIFLGSVTALFVLVEALRLLAPPVNRWLQSAVSGVSSGFKASEAAQPIGTTYFLVGALLAYLLFSRDVAVAALFFAAIGDAAAAAIGERYGRTRVGGKSIEGTAAFFASSLLVGAILVGAGLHLTWPAVAAGAAVAALAELSPLPINDNLAIPVVSGLAMTLLL